VGVFAWLGARKRAVASASVLTVSAITVTTFAVMYDGFPTTDVELNDGSVWITKSSNLLVGRFNHQSDVMDAGVRALGSDYDIVQSGRNVLVVDGSNGSLSPVDPATVTLSGDARLPPNAQVALGGSTVAVLQPDDGSVWMMGADSVSGFTPAAVDPSATVGAGASVAVAGDGTVFAVSPERGEVVTLRQDGEGVSSSAQAVDGLEEDDAVQIAAAGTDPVILNTTKGTFWSPAGGARETAGANTGILQQSSPDAATASFATASELVTIPVDGGDEARTAAGGEGTAAAPVTLKGCVYGAWSGSGRFVRDCVGDANDLTRDIDGLTSTSKLVFRVNRDVVMLNDTVGGTAWLAAEDLDRVDDWSAITPPETGETSEDNETELSEETSLPERTEINHPPVAVDDDFGVRPGRTTVLPVLDNDSDPDGDVLTASAPSEISIGTISPIYGGRALQVNVPENATGSVNVTYEANDGRPGGTDDAVISISVHDWSVNSAPEQRKVSTITVEQGGRISYDALLDWIDPDGDDLFLQAASAENGHEVDFTPDGQLSFRATGTVQGRSVLTIIVSDGQQEMTGTINVDVRPTGSTKPVPTPDHVVLRVGESTTVSPLENDVSPSGAPLRLARVTEIAGADVVPDYASGTFSFVSQVAGTYYIQYLVTDGSQQNPGIVRVDVLEALNPDDPPIAVRDTALLPGGGEVKVDVLANDSDPSGGILVVQSVEVPPGARIAVSVVDHRYLVITDQAGLQVQATVKYRISNGTKSAEGDVVVIPVPAPSQLRPPVANEDTAIVRAGDIVTIPVLENDYHPNGDLIQVAPDLIEPLVDPADGMMFVSEDTLRFRAGDVAKTVYATYEVVDSQGQKDAGYVTITILPRDDENNSAPRPRDLTARTVSGSVVRIPIPLDGIDPDGDSVQLLGLGSAPAKGSVVIEQTWLEYSAFADATGVDEFTYQVQDRLGRTATATVRVGIAPPDSVNQAPFAVTDYILVRPDRRVAVPVLLNDSDPEGAQPILTDALVVPDGIASAEVSGDRVVVHTGEEPGTYTIQYRIRDDMGATADGALVVEVDPDVPLLPPIARDDRITVAQVGEQTRIPVAVLENDEDPDGVKADLKITVDDPEATVGADGIVTVPITDVPQIITYTVTDEDDLSASAFILVPGTADLRPTLRSTGGIEVLSGETREIDLADHVVVAGGGRAIVTEAAKVSAAHANGAPLVKDASTLVYTSADRYFGQDAITFEVTDGTGPDDPAGRTAVLTIPITVLPPENQAPTMTNASVQIAPGEDATVTPLVPLTADPDPEDAGGHTYRLVSSTPSGFTADLDGDALSIAADANTPKGTTATFEVEVRDPEGLTGTGTVSVTVTASTRRLPVAVDDVLQKAPQGRTQTIDVVANDDNPFPDTPLNVVALEVESGEVQSAPRVVNGNRVEVTPGADYVGSLVVRYTIQDKTEDADRQTDGRIRLTVQGRPATPGTPTVTSVQDRTVVLSWTPPVNNGAVITHYTVRSTVGEYVRECASTTCTLTGLTNNVEYNFTVTATNEVGESDPSAPSATARPDARPDTPQAPRFTTPGFGDKQVMFTWVTPPTPGSPVESFNLEISPAPLSGSSVRTGVTGNSFTWPGLENGTSYQVRVQAVNRAPEPSAWSPWSTSMIPAAPPGAPAQPTTERLSPVGTQAQLQVNWTQPAINGDPISNYIVRVYRGGTELTDRAMTVSGTQRSQAFNLDVSEAAYTFTVTARNKAGDGPASPQTAARRAFTQPGAPTVTAAAPADRSLTFTATAGAGNGASAAELQYQYSLNGGTWTNISPNRSGTTLSGTIGGLSNGTGYALRLRAYHTLDGTNPSPESNTSAQVIPFGPVGTPALSVSASGSTLTFSWSAPATNGRSITMQINEGGGWANTSLSGTKSYSGWSNSRTVSVRAVDAEGQIGPVVTKSGSTGPQPTRVTASRGAWTNCQYGGTNCWYANLTTENIAGGSYRLQCIGNGRQWNTYEGPISVPSTGTIQLPCHYGNAGLNHTVYIVIYGGPGGTYTSESFNWG